jgi:hypothetical protein
LKKTLLLPALILLCAGTLFALESQAERNSWAESRLAVIFAAACQGPVQYCEIMQQVEVEFFFKMRELPAAELQKLVEDSLDNPHRFLELAEILWPAAFPESYDSRGIYTFCGVIFNQLNEALLKKQHKKTTPLLAQWKSCLSEIYRNDMPELALRFLQIYKQFLGQVH